MREKRRLECGGLGKQGLQRGAPKGFSSPCGPTGLLCGGGGGRLESKTVSGVRSQALDLAFIFGKFLLAGPLGGLLGRQ